MKDRRWVSVVRQVCHVAGCFPAEPFTNEVVARVALCGIAGSPIPSLRCPVFVAVCDMDSVAPPGRTLALTGRGPTTGVRGYPVGHFDIYVDEGH
ncbi:hypothetical protein [Nocardia wallacei]|uniref:hypothetical protein n=1 Tax=Nocardia wallacei TaxID=480035 RepID=UPI00245643F4|nr:hypothetical protein [Nocardia wallacei]